jgi:hypothetical protein
MGTRRWLMALVPLVVLLGSLLVQCTTAQEQDTAEGPEASWNFPRVDALISIDTNCIPTAVTPDPVKAHHGSKIRWGVTSECNSEVTVGITMKGEDPLKGCTGNRKTKKERYKAGKSITCKVNSKVSVITKYGYNVIVGDHKLDPQIEVRP